MLKKGLTRVLIFLPKNHQQGGACDVRRVTITKLLESIFCIKKEWKGRNLRKVVRVFGKTVYGKEL